MIRLLDVWLFLKTPGITLSTTSEAPISTFFDSYEDSWIARALFDTAIDWAKRRGLGLILGPMGFGGATGGGALIDGFEHRAAMTMMTYNHPYYAGLLAGVGFEKHLDLYSALIDAERFHLPDRVRRVAERVLTRGNFKVLRFKNRGELKRIAMELGRVYNESEEQHLETYTYSEGELRQVIKDLLLVADPSLIKVLTYRDEIVGYLFAFPDLSAALKRSGGRLNPLVLLDFMRESKRTDWLIINGAGILPPCQRLGGNALLYYELEKTVRESNYRYADLVQIAETTTLMLSDIETLRGKIYKTHRIYRLNL